MTNTSFATSEHGVNFLNSSARVWLDVNCNGIELAKVDFVGTFAGSSKVLSDSEQRQFAGAQKILTCQLTASSYGPVPMSPPMTTSGGTIVIDLSKQDSAVTPAFIDVVGLKDQSGRDITGKFSLTSSGNFISIHYQDNSI